MIPVCLIIEGVRTLLVIQNEVKNLLQNHATASIEILRSALDDWNMGFDTPSIDRLSQEGELLS